MPKTPALLIAAFLFALSSGFALAQFDETPTSPLPINDSSSAAGFDIQVHSRDAATWSDSGLESMQNQHGTNCAGPPATHENHSYDGAVFVCNGHVMTSINAGGYGEIVITPSQLADWSSGAATIQWEMSTERLSNRDWPDLWVTPWNQNLTLPFDEGDVDNQGIPLTAIHVNLNNTQNAWLVTTVKNGVQSSELNSRYATDPVGEGIASSVNQAATRQTFKLTVNRTHLKMERLASATAPAAVYFDGDVPDVGFTQGVVQFAHHSYNPTKGDGCGSVCKPGTWHWDEMRVNPAVSFGITKTHTRALFANGSVTFDAPAPANSWLRFSAVGLVQYSVNGGASYQTASKQAFVGHYEHASPYFVSIPAGTQTVSFRFASDDWYEGPYVAQDFAIWSKGTGSSAPSSTATPAKSPTQTPTSRAGSPTPTSATKTPIATTPAKTTATPRPGTATPAATSKTPATTATVKATATKTAATSTPAPETWTATAKVSSSKLSRGKSQKVTVNVLTNQKKAALVDIEIYDANGEKVSQTVKDNISFAAGKSQSFNASWTVPGSADKGVYTVKVGIFAPAWGDMLKWNDDAVRFSVQ